MERLACGCLIGTVEVEGENVLMYEPCSLDCPNYQYLLAEAARQDKPLATFDVR